MRTIRPADKAPLINGNNTKNNKSRIWSCGSHRRSDSFTDSDRRMTEVGGTPQKIFPQGDDSKPINYKEELSQLLNVLEDSLSPKFRWGWRTDQLKKLRKAAKTLNESLVNDKKLDSMMFNQFKIEYHAFKNQFGVFKLRSGKELSNRMGEKFRERLDQCIENIEIESKSASNHSDAVAPFTSKNRLEPQIKNLLNQINKESPAPSIYFVGVGDMNYSPGRDNHEEKKEDLRCPQVVETVHSIPRQLHAPNLTLIDIGSELLESAKKEAKKARMDSKCDSLNINSICGDISKLEIPEKSVDAFIMLYVLQYPIKDIIRENGLNEVCANKINAVTENILKSLKCNSAGLLIDEASFGLMVMGLVLKAMNCSNEYDDFNDNTWNSLLGDIKNKLLKTNTRNAEDLQEGIDAANKLFKKYMNEKIKLSVERVVSNAFADSGDIVYRIFKQEGK